MDVWTSYMLLKYMYTLVFKDHKRVTDALGPESRTIGSCHEGVGKPNWDF